MAACSIVQLFRGLKSNYNFEDFLRQNPESKALIQHVADNFMLFDAFGTDISEKYTETFNLLLTQRHSFLFSNGFSDDDLEIIKSIVGSEILNPNHEETAADVLLPSLATAFMSHVTGASIEDTVDELPVYFRKTKTQ